METNMSTVTYSAGSTNGKLIRVRGAAEQYLTRGWVPIPLKYKSKQPIPTGWEKITLDGFDIDTHFPVHQPRNIGISLGAPSNGLIDCDLDCEEARRAAAVLLPPTGMIWGRKAAPDSHRGYLVVDPPAKATEPYTDPVRKGKNARLLELRSTGGQTVVPPSILPGDEDSDKIEEPCVWRSNEEPTHIELGCLRRAMSRAAVAALLGRYWLTGNRHTCALALAGGLFRAGWSEDETVLMVRAVCAAGGDDEGADRERAASDTADRIRTGKNITGWPTLAEALGEHGDTIVHRVRGWLGVRDEHQPPRSGRSRTQTIIHDTEFIEGIGLHVSHALGKPGKFVVVAVTDGGELHRDTIDPNSATSRTRFIEGVMKRIAPGAGPDKKLPEVREKLDEWLRSRAAAPAADPTPSPSDSCADEDPREAELARMSEEIRAEANEMLRNPKLLDLVTSDIRALGVVGEKKNRLLLYLTGTSAQLPRPLAVIVRGASSSGKSYVAEQVSRLFPSEVVLRVTSLSTQALYYFAPGSLRHRWIVAGERSRLTDDDAAEATRALREMIESGRLSKAVPVKQGEQHVTRQIEQEGPIAFSESTTAPHIDEEDANRCLLLTTDETEAQTKRILGATASAASGANRADAERVIAVHHAIQRTIPRVDVIVPYAEAIAEHYPTARLESRRDFRHLLQLINATALLHFRQRERESSGAVLATMADYTAAEELAREPLGAAASGLTAGARDLLARLRETFEQSEFTTTLVKQLGGASPRTLEIRLLELNAVGGVEQTEPAKGRVPAKWKLTGRHPASGEGILPSADDVRESFARCERADNT
jgi:hypothetical protein